MFGIFSAFSPLGGGLEPRQKRIKEPKTDFNRQW
jgi:hypothetical protein